MSEATTETPTETPAVEVDDQGRPTVLDQVGIVLYDNLKAKSELAKSMSAEIAAASGNTSEMLDNFRATYGQDSDATDEDKKRAEQIEKANAVLLKLETERDAAINAKIEKIVANAAETLAPKTEELANIRKGINGGRNYLIANYGENAVFGLPVITKAGSSGGTGKGAGQPRLRGLNVFVNGKLTTQKDQKGNEKSSLSSGAKAAKVETSVLREKFYEAAGTRDAANFPETTEFEIVGSDNVTYKVKIQKQPETSEE